MKRKAFTLVELAVSTLIVSIIALTLVIILRGNLNTLKFGQRHMDFNQKVLLAMRRIFYDLKYVNPILIKSETSGYAIKGEHIGEPKPRKVFIRKSREPNLDQDELEFVIDSNLDIEDTTNIKYFLANTSLKRETRDAYANTKVETVLEHVASFTVDNDANDIKQVFVSFVASDDKNIIKREVDFAVRLESDFVYVDKQEL